MSAVCILAPAIIGGWPAISAAAAGVAAAMGLTVLDEEEASRQRQTSSRTVELELENSEVLEENLVTGDRLTMEGAGMKVSVLRDERGQLRVCISSESRSRQEMEAFGQQVMEKMTQMFIYNKLMTELRHRKFEIVNTSVDGEEAVHLHIRNTVG